MQAPQGKHLFGFVKLGEKGQILIPKEARDIFGLKPGDKLLMLGDEAQGIALVKADPERMFELFVSQIPDVEDEEPTTNGGDAL